MNITNSTNGRRAAVAATAAALVVGGIAIAGPASAAENDVVAGSGTLDWGFKQSFRTYVSNGGEILVSDGAERSGTGKADGFLFPVAAGHVTDADDLTIDTAGTGEFSYEAHFFDVKLSNIQVVVDGGTASLVADTYLWAGIDFGEVPQGTHEAEDVTIAEVTNADVSIADGVVTVAGTGVTITEDGAAANPLYAAGTEVDDFTVSAEVEGAAEGPGDGENPGDGDEPSDAEDGDLDVTIPDDDDEQNPGEPGELSVAWAGGAGGSLGQASADGNRFVAEGGLNDIAVTDTRTEGDGWTLNASVSDFSNGSESFSAGNLAGTSTATGDAAAAGAISGFGGDTVLANSVAGGSSTVSTDLSLTVPGDTAAGAYTATVTLSAIG